MLSANAMSIGYEYVGKPISKFPTKFSIFVFLKQKFRNKIQFFPRKMQIKRPPPVDATELNGVGLRRDFLSKLLGLGAVEKAHLLRFSHSRFGSHCHLVMIRRVVVEEMNGIVRLDGPIVRVPEALDLAPDVSVMLLLL